MVALTSDKAHYYVSAIDGPKTYIIAGPYKRHADALAQVDAACRLADERDGRAWFMAWGTCGSDEAIKTPLGPEWTPPPKSPSDTATPRDRSSTARARTGDRWAVRYRYLDPAAAGSLVGGMILSRRPRKDETIRAPLGRAIVTACDRFHEDPRHPDRQLALSV